MLVLGLLGASSCKTKYEKIFLEKIEKWECLGARSFKSLLKAHFLLETFFSNSRNHFCNSVVHG